MGTMTSANNKAQRIDRLDRPARIIVRVVLCAMILSFSAVAFYFLLPRLVSQIYHLHARSLTRQGHYGLATAHLKKANEAQARDWEVLRQLGDVYSQLAERSSAPGEAIRYSRNAKDAYLQAAARNPQEVEIAFRLAEAEARLEDLHKNVRPADSDVPYDARPYFEKTLQLRPYGIFYQYAFAQYLYRHDQKDEFLEAVRKLSKIYPATYDDFKSGPVWSPAVKDAVKLGLEDAIREHISPRIAHRTLATLLADDANWNGAIEHYRTSLLHREFDNRFGDYLHLGRLYLKSGQPEAAEAIFFRALDMSDDKERDLQAFYPVYKQEGYLDELYAFYQEVAGRLALSPRIDLLMARTLMDAKRFTLAQRILNELIDQDPSAEAYYWLARVAEKEEDWNGMELAIQKATVLDPGNRHYRQIFFGLLKRLGRTEAVENEIDRTIRTSEDPSPNLFTERARIRWKREDYRGALEDWRTAIQLSPPSASLYAQAAEACIQLGKWSEALDYYQRAVRLEPENHRYSQRYRELKAGSS